ncbi:hypothetical protein POM88_034817 [Heracleum sosnowskyi]|uniref:Uncharacterized protein n=1 Tax=Heracleum sosnowskyi TaxID=360622 RepID=A0AAD8HM89_9APIA|nr:hypothetical protein POM88_034817 [Heracleum sosnowskyi]
MLSFARLHFFGTKSTKKLSLGGFIQKISCSICGQARSFGVTKGAAIHHILGEIVHHNDVNSHIDCVLCIGHPLPKDEDICPFFEPHHPAITARISSASPVNGLASKTCSNGNWNGTDGCSAMRQAMHKGTNVVDF